jgi:large exoprotein involved in heme utilization and adhesion
MATDAIAISGRNAQGISSGLFSNTNGDGDAGSLLISTPTLRMDDGFIQGGATQRSRGNAGDIELRVGRLTLTGGAEIGSGEAGVISLETPETPVVQDVLKRFETNSTRSSGRGGQVTVLATDAIAISGRNTQGNPSGLFSNATGLGNAGSLLVATPSLRLEDQGGITAIAFGPGNGGDIALSVGQLTLTGGARIDSGSFGSGRGGAVTLRAQDLQLTDGAVISASSFGTGDAGTIRIQAGERFRSQQGSVAATAARAGGGTIEVHAGRLVQLLDSEITTSIRGGGGDAGNIILNAPWVVIAGSQSIANAFEGRGGNLALAAEVLLADPSSRLAASGTLEITAAGTALTGSIAPLPQTYVNVATLLPARCAARFSGGKASSIVVGGRPGLPADPSGVLPSPLALEERLVADPALTGAPHRPPAAAQFALLAEHEKALPRLWGDQQARGCPQ